MTFPKLPVLGYARLSRAGFDSTSLAKQHELIANFAASKGWRLVDVVEDPDLSATASRLDRPGLTELRRRIHAGEGKAVVVWRLDRIARSVVDFTTLVEEGLNIVSVTESGIDTTTVQGKAFAQLLQVFAELEASTTGERIKSMHVYLKRARRWTGGARPYGYQPVRADDGRGTVLTPDPVEAAVVARVAQGIIAGKTTYAIAQELNDEGVPTAGGKQWTPSTLRRIIRSDTILGRIKHQGHLVLEVDGTPVVAWEPLLDLETAERVRAATDSTPRGAVPRKRAARLLSGMIPCPGCGYPLIVRSRANGVSNYGCASRVKGRTCPRAITIEASRVEAEVERRFLEAFGATRVVEEVIHRRPVAGLAEAEAAVIETAAAMTEPGADLPALMGKLTELTARRDRMAAISSEPTREMVETDQTFAEVWEGADVDRRRALLEAAGVVVEVAPATRRGFWDPSRVSVSREPDYVAGQTD